MQALTLLREHLLTELKMTADKLVTFVENGTVYTVPGPPVEQGGNKDFELRYDGVVYVLEQTTDARYICWIIGEWMNSYQPEHSADDIAFEADILSQDSVEFEFRLRFRETIRVAENEDGSIKLTSCFCEGEDSEPLDVSIREPEDRERA